MSWVEKRFAQRKQEKIAKNLDSYDKHNLYWGVYKPQDNFVKITEASWVVRKMYECGTFTYNPNDRGTICLILEDKKNNFWPVMSFLGKEEVKELIESLTEFVK